MKTIQELYKATIKTNLEESVHVDLPRARHPVSIQLYEKPEKPKETRTPCAPPFQVDFVFTWVNGSNPELRTNFTKYTNATLEQNRYVDIGQLKYALRGIEANAPWFNHIYIVTNGEKPAWLASNPKISIVSHWDIFRYKSALPVFNSNAIEMNLHRISHLTDNFIYCNDDFTLTQPVCWSDFYTEQEGTKIYYMKNWGKIGHPEFCREECRYWLYADGICQPKCNVVQCRWDGGDCEQHNMKSTRKSAQYGHAIDFTNVVVSEAFGKRNRYYPAHVPLLIHKRKFDHVEKMFINEVNQTSFHRVRAISDLQTQFLYVNTLSEKFEEKTEWIDAANFMHFIPASNDLGDTMRMFKALNDNPRKMVCINDNLNYEQENATLVVQLIQAFYETTFPNKSSLEI